MQAMVVAGVVLTLLGLAGLIWCIVLAVQARRAGGSAEDMRARLRRVVTLNLVAMGLSALGLAFVVFGLFLR
jgi:hypothetical protein